MGSSGLSGLTRHCEQSPVILFVFLVSDFVHSRMNLSLFLSLFMQGTCRVSFSVDVCVIPPACSILELLCVCGFVCALARRNNFSLSSSRSSHTFCPIGCASTLNHMTLYIFPQHKGFPRCWSSCILEWSLRNCTLGSKGACRLDSIGQ